MDEGPLQKHVISTTLDLPPSCVEFSPESPEYFVVGTYNLEWDAAADEPQHNQDTVESDKSKDGAKVQERNGSLVLYRFENDQLYVNF
jgi:diphthine methyl ester acylhydrolase